jgi:hypothetical protein
MIHCIVTGYRELVHWSLGWHEGQATYSAGCILHIGSHTYETELRITTNTLYKKSQKRHVKMRWNPSPGSDLLQIPRSPDRAVRPTRSACSSAPCFRLVFVDVAPEPLTCICSLASTVILSRSLFFSFSSLVSDPTARPVPLRDEIHKIQRTEP